MASVSGTLAGKARERRKVLDRLARRPPSIDGRGLVGIAHRHARIDHQVIGKIEEGADRLVKGDPGLLGTGVQAVIAGQEADGLEIAADVGPLGGAVRLFAGEEQADRSAEELPVPGVLPIARRLVRAGNADRGIQHLAGDEAAGVIRLAERMRVNRVVGALALRQLGHARRQQRLESLERLAGERVNDPRLHVAGRRRARRLRDNVTDGLLGNGSGKEGPAGIPGGDGVAHVHEENSVTLTESVARRRAAAKSANQIERIHS